MPSTMPGRPPMHTTPPHHADLQGLLQAMTRAEAGIRLRGLDDGLADLRTLWQQHVTDVEEHVLRRMVAADASADGLAGFLLTEHADLTMRLASLSSRPASAERAQAIIALIHQLIQHVFLEARVLSAMGAEGLATAPDTSAGTA